MPVVVDLSKATKLQDAIFRCASFSVEWIAAAFQTTIPEHRELRKISIAIPRHVSVDTIKRSVHCGGWMDLDRLLVRFWESRSTRPKVVCMVSEGQERDIRGFTRHFFPKLAERGMIDILVE